MSACAKLLLPPLLAVATASAAEEAATVDFPVTQQNPEAE